MSKLRNTDYLLKFKQITPRKRQEQSPCGRGLEGVGISFYSKCIKGDDRILGSEVISVL